MFTFKIRIDPSPAAVARIIGGLGKEFSDWRPVWRKLLDKFGQGEGEIIRQQGAPLGVAWAVLKPDTIYRHGKYGGIAAMVLSGDTLATMSIPALGMRSMTANKLAYGPDQKYQFVQQFGSPARGIPARPLYGWTESLRGIALEMMNEYARYLLQQASDKILGAVNAGNE